MFDTIDGTVMEAYAPTALAHVEHIEEITRRVAVLLGSGFGDNDADNELVYLGRELRERFGLQLDWELEEPEA
jgi:hypothetical protein